MFHIMRLSFILISTLCVISATAQTVQKGVVKEYNEKAQKTPLAGVELNVRSANSEVSDNAGNFTLQFLTLKPGEKVNVRRIEKLGYEVFNKEAIEQWNLNPNTPFVIVMCRSDRFKKIRDNYEKVSSESYARQLKKEEASLLKQKEQGKIKEEEYQKQLYELRENYEKQLDNLDNYIDRFSRIDLSELSAVEQEIIALVQEGRIEEAIAKYEEQNYVDKYTKEVAEIKEVSSAIDRLSEVRQTKEASKDSLLAAIDRQIETLKLAGGKDNFDRIGVILSEIVASDNLNKNLLWKYIEFLDSQSLVMNLEKSLASYLQMPLTNEEKAVALRLLVKTKINAQKYEEADSITSELLELLSDRNALELTDMEISNIYFTIGGLYMDAMHPELAMPFMKKAIDFASYAEGMDIEELEIFLKVRIGMAYIAEENGDTDKFKELTDYTYSIVEPLMARHYGFDSYPDILKCLVDLGQLQELVGQYENAMRLYDYAEGLYMPLVNTNPIRFKPAYLNLLIAKAICLYKQGDFEKSEKTYQEALGVIKEIQHKSPKRFLLSKRIILNNLCNVYLKTEQLDKAVDAAKTAYGIIADFYAETPFFYEAQYKSANTNLARVYEGVEDYDEAERYYLEAQKINKKISDERGEGYVESYWVNTLDPALFYVNLGHEELGIPFCEELVKIGNDNIKEGNRLYDAFQSIKLFLVRGYRKAQRYSEAEAAVEDYLKTNPERWNAWVESARIKTYLRKNKEARENIDKAIKLNPDALNELDEDDIIWTVIKK